MRRLIPLTALLAITFCSTVRADGPSKSEIKRLAGELAAAAQAQEWGKAEDAMRALAAADSVKVFKLLTKVVERAPTHTGLHVQLRNAAKRMTSAKVRKLVAKTVKRSRSPLVRRALLEYYAGEKQWGPLIVAIADKDERVAAFAAGRLIDARVTAALGPLIDQFEKEKQKKPGIWDLLWSELGELLGQRCATAKGYRARWAAVQRSGGLAKVKPRKPAASEALLAGRAVERTRVVFVLDVSGGMKVIDPNTTKTRLEQTRQALKTLLETLPEQYRVNIVAYSTHVKLWRAADGDRPPRLHRMTPKNRAAAIKFVESFKPAGVCATDSALVRAFEVEGARSAYLLSHGFTTHDGTTKVPTEVILDELKKHRYVVVNTLGFKAADREALKAIAKAGRGHYTDLE